MREFTGRTWKPVPLCQRLLRVHFFLLTLGEAVLTHLRNAVLCLTVASIGAIAPAVSTAAAQEPTTRLGPVMLVNAADNTQCLTDELGPSNAVWAEGCSGASNQQWFLEPRTDGTHQLRGVADSSSCIAGPVQVGPMVMRPCNQSDLMQGFLMSGQGTFTQPLLFGSLQWPNRYITMMGPNRSVYLAPPRDDRTQDWILQAAPSV